MHELVISGHSFGGITALQLAKQDIPNLKAVISLDPWYLPVFPLAETGKYGLDAKSPHALNIMSERFPAEMADSSACQGVYDQKVCADNFVKASADANAKLE